MLIKVTKQKAVWGIGDLWLTYRDDPVDINLPTVEPHIRDAVLTAIRRGELYVVGGDVDLEENKDRVDKKKIEELLSKGVHKIRKEIQSISGIKFLEALVEAEKAGKNRSSLLVFIDRRIRDILNSLPAGKLDEAYEGLIEEEEEEQIEIVYNK